MGLHVRGIDDANLSSLEDVTEYSLVKRFTTQPKLMKMAYDVKLEPGDAIGLVILLHDEWGCNIPAKYKLSSRPIKFVWNTKNGNAKGGYYLTREKELRPFLKLPLEGLTAGLVLHEYCHVVTIYLEVAERQRGKKKINKHGPIFRAIFDYMLFSHKEDWLNLVEKGLDIPRLLWYTMSKDHDTLYCKHCGNADESMLEVLVNSDETKLIYCIVCSKTTYIRKEHGEDNRKGLPIKSK